MQPLLLQKFSPNKKNQQTSKQINFKANSYYTLLQLMKKRISELLTESYLKKNNKQLNKVVYQIQINRNQQSWTIIKRFEDFIVISKYLSHKYKELNQSDFSIKKQSSPLNFAQNLKYFEVFLNQVRKNVKVLDDQYFLYFIEMPMNSEAKKIKFYREIILKKRSGGRYNQAGCRKCISLFGNWKNRLFVVTSEGIFYCENWQNSKSQIKEMIAFSIHFKVEFDIDSPLKIIIYSCHRVLQLKAPSLYEFVIFIDAVRLSLQENDYLQPKRFASFANVRQNCHSKFYIDGQNYFKDLYYRLIEAKKQVFITDWMISPHFLLIRPNSIQSQFRLDNVLKKIAQNGVRVYIILYQQFKMALNTDSQYVKQYLQSLHTNIKVVRHPNFILIPFLWSHHQKIVIIDQNYGFLGGLDICFGRFDNQKHNISDLGESVKNEFVYFWQGLDYCNFRRKDLPSQKEFRLNYIDRHTVPRLPWHDIGVQIIGDSVIDLTRHFVQYWNFVNFQTNFDERQILLQVGISDKLLNKKIKFEKLNRKTNTKMKKSEYFKNQISLQSNKSTYVQPSQRPTSYVPIYSNRFNMSVNQKQIRNRTFTSKFKQLDPKLIQLYDIAQTEEDILKQKLYYISNFQNIETKKKLNIDFKKLNPFREQFQNNQLLILGEHHKQSGKQNQQIIRSASTWSLGIQQDKQQKSIYYAYIELISQAEEYIFIENQFFICDQNKLAQAIKIKIQNAYIEKKKFKVIILIPLLPGFSGQIYNQNAAVLRVQMHLQYQTICRGANSLLENLKHIENLDQYIKFYSLRAHGVIDQIPMTQMIYIHSKLLIIDDEVVLLGSANINDRSLVGTRDSQIGIIIQDNQEIIIKRNKQKKYVKKFAHQLRKNLYMEHFGLTQQQSQDALNESVWQLISKRAKRNTQIYRTLFGCYPDDTVKTYEQLKILQKTANYKLYEQLSVQIKGNVVQYPLEFLKNEDLNLKPNQKQFYVPYISFK